MCHVFWGIGSLAIQAVAAALITGLSYLVICKNRIRDLFRRKADKTEEKQSSKNRPSAETDENGFLK